MTCLCHPWVPPKAQSGPLRQQRPPQTPGLRGGFPPSGTTSRRPVSPNSLAGRSGLSYSSGAGQGPIDGAWSRISAWQVGGLPRRGSPPRTRSTGAPMTDMLDSPVHSRIFPHFAAAGSSC